MRFTIFPSRPMVTAAVLAALFGTLATVRADNIITYNFNSTNGSQEGWYPQTTGTAPEWGWNVLQSSTGGGWQAFSGTNTDNSGAYLVSPCMELLNNKDWVNVTISHRYNFPVVSGSANQLGQIQFRINGGGWRGIPTQYFVDPNNTPIPDNYPPNYGPPTQSLFDPLISSSGTNDVQAWSGTTATFATGKHETSSFTLFYGDFGLVSGDDIEFQFLLATNLGVTGSNTLVWEVNKVQINGVVPCVVPEPGAIALAGIGGGLLILAALRRTRRGRPFACSTIGSLVVSGAVIAAVVAGTPAQADVLFDFQIDQNGSQPGVTWSGTYQTVSGTMPVANRWTYVSTGDKRWSVKAMGVDSLAATTAAPPWPIALGQLQYQLNASGTWVGLPTSAWTSGGSVNTDDTLYGFGASPFKDPLNPLDPRYVDQTAFVAPTYETPTASPFISFVAPGGASFVGQSNGWSTLYVPSEAFLVVPTGITTMQLRLTEANLGGNCNNNEGWNVRMLAVEFQPPDQPPVPEPGTLALAVAGGGAACAARALRRRRSPAALEAE